jgi:EGF-like domain
MNYYGPEQTASHRVVLCSSLSIGRGTCLNGVCQCETGFAGSRCDFPEPCAKLSMDSRTAGFTGTRHWSTSFQRFVVDGNAVDVYGRPVYISDVEANAFDVIFFTGRVSANA